MMGKKKKIKSDTATVSGSKKKKARKKLSKNTLTQEDKILKDFQVSVFNAPVSNVNKYVDVDWDFFCEKISEPLYIPDNKQPTKRKYGQSFLRGVIRKGGTRKDAYLEKCCLLILDVDKGLDGKPIPSVHKVDAALGDIIHIVYTSATPGRCRIVVPVSTYDKRDTEVLTKQLYDYCMEAGLAFDYAEESSNKSQPWYFGQTVEGNEHVCLINHEGKLFKPVPPKDPLLDNFALLEISGNENIDSISSGKSAGKKKTARKDSRKATPSTNVDSCMVKGDSPETHQAKWREDLRSGTQHEAAKIFAGMQYRVTNLTPLQIFNLMSEDINAFQSEPDKKKRWHDDEGEKLLEWFDKEIAAGRISRGGIVTDTQFNVEEEEDSRPFTDYPYQGKVMEKLISELENLHTFKNRQLAVVQAHAIISTLGGRVYTFESGNGIVWTALVVGRSGIGKGFIKDGCSTVFRQLSSFDGIIPFDPMGAAYYTSVKNVIEDMAGTGTKLSIRTESGQTDKSKAGDMGRVRMLELELATKSGSRGYIASGGQNEKIKPVYSPSMTTVRETVHEANISGDIKRGVDVSGDSGRRSHVVVNILKDNVNREQQQKLSDQVIERLYCIYTKTVEVERRDIYESLPKEKWIFIEYEDYEDFLALRDEWVKKENKAALENNHYLATFYARLHEKVPAWAGRLAVLGNPDKPVVTNSMISIAVASLEEEAKSYDKKILEDIDPWSALVGEIKNILLKAPALKTLYKPTKSEAKAGKENLMAMVSVHAAQWPKIKRSLGRNTAFMQLKQKDNFEIVLERKLTEEGIVRISPDMSKERWGVKSIVYQLQDMG